MSQPNLLVCDHRGRGLGSRLRALIHGQCACAVTSSLGASLSHLAATRVDMLVLDPITDAALELPAIEAAARLQRQAKGSRSATVIERGPPTLVVVDSSLGLLPSLRAKRPEGASWDQIRREAPNAEFQFRLEQLLQQVEVQGRIDALQHSATHDDRTDLLRPNAFRDQLAAHFSAAQRHHMDLALLMIDLDGFGQVNKRFGHHLGDELIRAVGGVITQSLRTEDLAGRHGGDEFSILLPYTGRLAADHVVQRLLEGLRELSGAKPGHSEPLRVSGSLGLESYGPGDSLTLEDLALHAERAMREAKRLGGDRALHFRDWQAS